MRIDNEEMREQSHPDEALCLSAQQGDDAAAEDLVKRYARLVKTCARSCFLMGADTEDLLQEGMLGLMKAIREFNPANGVPFSAFARICVTRKLYSAVRAAAASKHSPLNYSVSIDRPLFEDLAESHNRVTDPMSDPELLVISNEEREEMVRRLCSLLSEFEAKVLALFLDGLSYEEMSAALNKPVKSIDNAIQRIKRKSAAMKSQ